MIRFTCAMFFSLALAGAAIAQDGQFVFRRDGFVSIAPRYEWWNVGDSSGLSQTAVIASAYLPLGREWSVSFRTTGAGVSGDVPSLNGLGDTQLGLSYNFLEQNIVINTSLNVPSGKQQLTSQEFQTSILISKSVLDLSVPNFGQGFGVTIGGIWGIQLSEEAVVGVGVSYAYLGAYTPLDQYTDKYDPGDELLLTGGIELRVSRTVDVSGDVIFTTYGRDKLDDVEVFGVGNKIVAHAQVRKSFVDSDLRVFALYRSRGRSEFSVGEAFVTETERFMPNQFEIRAQYQHRFSQNLSGRIAARLELTEETADRYSGASILGVGVGSDISLDGRFVLAPVAEYDFGTLKDGLDVTGIKAGIGISWRF